VRLEHVAHAASILHADKDQQQDTTSKRVSIASVVGFPTTSSPPISTSTAKAAEAAQAVADGADEIDIVMDYPGLTSAYSDDSNKQQNPYTSIYNDIATVRAAIPASTLLKVILENAPLTPLQIAHATVIACLAGADYIKTSTGFHSAGGAKAGDVRLMREVCQVCEEGLTRTGTGAVEGGRRVRVKASGRIRTIADVRAMVEAGAERIGASAGCALWRS
jgi:deoxyribose-phosphate aldolase